MRVFHNVSAVFDDPNLVSCAGLVAGDAAGRAGWLSQLVGERLSVAVGERGGEGRPRWSRGWSPARTRSMTWTCCGTAGWVGCSPGCGRRRRWARSCARSRSGMSGSSTRSPPAVDHGWQPGETPLLAGAGRGGVVDIDDTVREIHGYAKQGAGYGYTGVKGLNALIGDLSTPMAAPVIAAARLRKGPTNSARGAARLVADALGHHHGAARPGRVAGHGRADSAFYRRDVIAAAAARRPVLGHRADEPGGARRSRHPRRRVDPDQVPEGDLGRAPESWVSDAEVAETGFTAFTSRRKAEQVTARLIVRRVKRLNPHAAQSGRAGRTVHGYRGGTTRCSPTHRCRVQAEETHRDHAIVEQVIADLKNGPLAHLPSGKFTANGAWLLWPHRVQPHPRRRRSRRARSGTPKPGDHRHPARPADRRPRPDRILRPAARPAPAEPTGPGKRSRLAKNGLHAAPPTGPPAPRPDPDHPPRTGPEQEPDVEDPDRPGDHSRLHHQARPTRLRTINEALRRWIRAQPSRPPTRAAPPCMRRCGPWAAGMATQVWGLKLGAGEWPAPAGGPLFYGLREPMPRPARPSEVHGSAGG